MAHTTRNKDKLVARVRRIRGQMEAVERALAEERGCSAVLHLIAGARGAISGLMAEVIEDHVEMHVASADLTEEARHEGAADLISVVRTYLK